MDQIIILVLNDFFAYKFLLGHKIVWKHFIGLSFTNISRACLQFLTTLPGSKHLGWNLLSESFALAWISLENISKQYMAIS